jgi:Spirocyclase AveC-like
MATVTDPAAPTALRTRRGAPPQTPVNRPVVWWGLLGAVMLAFMTYVMIRWVAGPYFKNVPGGPTRVTTPQKVALLAIQIGSPIGALFCLYWFLVRPWRREGRPSSAGLLVACYACLYFQDPLEMAGGYWFTYNSTLWNRGSWIPYLPLFNPPPGRPGHMMAEPVVGMGSTYVYFMVITVGLALAVLRGVEKRWPKVGVPGAIAAAFLSVAVLDIVAEVLWLRTSFYEYPGAPGPRLFSNSYMAFPLLESVLIPLMVVPFALLLRYRDDRGYTVIERGIEQLRLGGRAKVALRFLALLGASQLIFLACFTIPAYQMGANQHAWPKQVQERSYFLDGVCGAGTGRLCPGPAIPNSRPDSAFVGSNGTLVVPRSVRLPTPAPVLHGAH